MSSDINDVLQTLRSSFNNQDRDYYTLNHLKSGILLKYFEQQQSEIETLKTKIKHLEMKVRVLEEDL